MPSRQAPYKDGLSEKSLSAYFYDHSRCAKGVDLKLNAVQKIVEGKKVVIVDDSMVRHYGGSRAPHARAGGGASADRSPPVIDACLYGIAMPASKELIAYGRDSGAVAETIGADSLGYLSLKATVESVGLLPDQLCRACFTGSYPICRAL